MKTRILSGCALAVALCMVSGVLADETVVDQGFSRKFRQELTKLVEAGKTTPLAKLVEQLDRRRTKLDSLPETSDVVVGPVGVYARCKQSVVAVGRLYKCDRCEHWHSGSATGFIVSSDGVIATNYHVVENDEGETLAVMTSDGRVLPVLEVLAASASADCALIRVDAEGLVALPLRAASPVGTAINVISHPRGNFFTLTRGIISRYFRTRRNGRSGRWMAITADYAKGSSGGPLIDDTGAVVGMVSSTRVLYADLDDEIPTDPQMVLKHGVPAKAILSLIERD